MKISFVIYSLGSGGAERVVSLLANYLVNNYEVEIITFTKSESFYNLDNKIVHTKLGIDYISKNKIFTVLNFFKRVKKLSSHLKKSNPNIVVSFMTHTNILSIVASKIANKKIIISERIACDFYGKKINIIKNIVYRFCDLLIVQTKGDAKYYRVKKEIIPNPIEARCKSSTEENIV
ncbi:MAG: glycosyltransferase family 4 protein, partial [Epsilonproteobacteria bacterium]|nr:glycosyltransferase family 4 protein [Campylobacterota bacterium]